MKEFRKRWKRNLAVLLTTILLAVQIQVPVYAETPTEPVPTTVTETEPVSEPCPFVVSGGAIGTDYTYENNVTEGGLTFNRLTIKASGLTISNSVQQTDTVIKVEYAVRNITLAGVNITAPGNFTALSTGGNLTITLAEGTTNTLTGGSDSSSGHGIDATTLTINGTGTLNATGGSYIDPDYACDGNGIQCRKSVTITDGTVTTKGGGSNGAGIIFLGNSLNQSITISGGNVKATGGSNGFGIGGETATFSTGENGNAIIHVSSFGGNITKDENELSGIIFVGRESTTGYDGKVYGDQTLEKDYTNKAGEVLTIPEGTTLTLGKNVTLTNNGAIIVAEGGTLVNNGTISGSGSVTPKLAADIKGTDTEIEFTETYDISQLFTIPDGVEVASYSLEAGGTGLGTVSGNTLTVTKAGTFNIKAMTNATGIYEAGEKIVTLTVKDKSVITYTVTFDSNGGTSVDPQTITAGGKVTKPSNPTRSGYTFDGWYKEAEFTTPWDFTVDTVTGNVTLYAKWTKTTSGGGGWYPGYPSEPDTPAEPEAPFIKGEDGKEGWDAITDQTETAKDGDTIMVDMNGTTTVPKDVLESVKGKDIDIVFDMGNGMTWTVNGKDITADSLADINFGITSGTANIPVDVINKVTGEKYSMNLTLEHDGEFGFTAVLTINMEKKNSGLYANLFYYNEKAKKLEFVCADEIDKEGNADLTFTHASDYTIVIDKEPMSATEAEKQSAKKNLNKPVKAGKNYNILKWGKVEGADGYLVCGAQCDGKADSMKQLADLDSADILTYRHRNLKTNTFYKYKIYAYKLVNGEKIMIGSSVTLHSRTGSKNTVNPTGITVKQNAFTLEAGKTAAITAVPVFPNGKKVKVHVKMKYVVADSSIAAVSSTGKIKAKKKGSTVVYVIGQNGVYKKITVTVK